jgi:hypothetical protein
VSVLPFTEQGDWPLADHRCAAQLLTEHLV